MAVLAGHSYVWKTKFQKQKNIEFLLTASDINEIETIIQIRVLVFKMQLIFHYFLYRQNREGCIFCKIHLI